MYKFNIILCFLIRIHFTDAMSQESPVIPQDWYPLKVGSYWHYQSESGGFQFNAVRKAVKDSVVSGRRWIAIRNVDCSPPPSCSTETMEWYRFTDDNYLLVAATPDLDAPDTLLATVPTSIFLSEIPDDILPGIIDTLQHTRTGEMIRVGVIQDDKGNEADSTHLRLVAIADSSGIFLNEEFIYKIGRATNGLVGAVVDGVKYGDTELIEQIISVNKETITSASSKMLIQLFPNPSAGKLTVYLQNPDLGLHHFKVFNLIGQRIGSFSTFLLNDPSLSIDLSEITSRLSEGTYYLVINTQESTITTPFTILRVR